METQYEDVDQNLVALEYRLSWYDVNTKCTFRFHENLRFPWVSEWLLKILLHAARYLVS